MVNAKQLERSGLSVKLSSDRFVLFIDGVYSSSQYSVLVDFRERNVVWRRFEEREENATTYETTINKVDQSRVDRYLLGIRDPRDVQRFILALVKSLNDSGIPFYMPREDMVVVPIGDRFWMVFSEPTTSPVFSGVNSVLTNVMHIRADIAGMNRDEVYRLANWYLMFGDLRKTRYSTPPVIDDNSENKTDSNNKGGISCWRRLWELMRYNLRVVYGILFRRV